MNYQSIITSEPGKRGGRPCIRRMRIAVADVLGWLAAGMTHEAIIADYPELTEEDILPRVILDGEVALGEISLDFLAVHEQLQPFGMGNAQPLFLARGVRPLAEPVVMKEKHLRFTLGQNGTRHEAVFFNGAADPLPRPPWDVAFRIERNEWRGRVSVQIQIQRLRSAE